MWSQSAEAFMMITKRTITISIPFPFHSVFKSIPTVSYSLGKLVFEWVL